jgi:tetratricopeptide (TPR) repeat protein
LDKVIKLREDAIMPLPPSHPDRPSFLSNLAIAVHTRFQQLGDLSDLNKVIKLYDDALMLQPPDHPNRPSCLYNFAGVIHTRFEQSGDLSDLNMSIKLHEEVLALQPPGHPSQASYLNNLANALLSRFKKLGNLPDLDKAIKHHEEALTLRPTGHPDHSCSLHNLANAVKSRFDFLKQSNDLDRVLSLTSDALQCSPDTLRVRILTQRGDAFISRSKTLRDIDLAIAEYSCGAQFAFGNLSDRFTCCMEWVKWSTHIAREKTWQDAAAAYEVAIGLLPNLFWLGLDSASRLRALRRASVLGCDAATWFLDHGEPSRAVELLEQGRGVFWSHALQLQRTFDDLPEEFANRLKRLSDQLRIASVSETSMSSSDMLLQRQLQIDWANTLEEIRKIPEFQYFLRTKPFSQLAKAAKNGPVAILVASRRGCNAVLIRPGSTSPQRIQLDEINYEGAIQLGERWVKALILSNVQRDHGPSNNQGQNCNQSDLDHEMRRILADLWDQVVDPVLHELNLHVRIRILSSLCR